jgi:hypothetical protein
MFFTRIAPLSIGRRSRLQPAPSDAYESAAHSREFLCALDAVISRNADAECRFSIPMEDR